MRIIKNKACIFFLLLSVVLNIACAQTRQELQPASDITEINFPENTDKKLILLPHGLEIPECPLQQNCQDHQIRVFEHYTVCYRESYEQPEWAAYCLEASELEKNAQRQNDFRSDPQILTGSATPSDYKGSGFDRGHMAPAADFSFNANAMSDTFYMSNMSPQAPFLNRQTWQYLESQVRQWAKQYGRIYVVCGPVLEKPAEEYNRIGPNKVAVPEYFYKVLLIPLYDISEENTSTDCCSNIMMLAFIFPNGKCEGNFMDYIVSVDYVEERTGIDFFFLLDKDLQSKHESAVLSCNEIEKIRHF